MLLAFAFISSESNNEKLSALDANYDHPFGIKYEEIRCKYISFFVFVFSFQNENLQWKWKWLGIKK